MSTTLEPTSEPPPTSVDERLARVGFVTKLLQRPELGAMLGAAVVLIFFAVTADKFITLSGIARWTDVASTLGIMAVAVALLMIGGEFDLSWDVIQAIEDGEILFAVDQQQYLQGYLPVVFLTLNKTNLNTVGGGRAVLTGPGFVEKSNAARIKELAEAGTR